MGYLLIWVVCGLIAMSIYKGKGRSSTSGFLAGFFLGPLGIVLALLSSSSATGKVKRKLAEEEAMIKAGEAVRCPMCSELIRPSSKVCIHCKTNLQTKPV